MSVIYTVTLLGASHATAQTIRGNVYGGGNLGNLSSDTKVELRGGIVEGNVYGGARIANVGGHAYVHINGAEATDTLVVKGVYGGNDIAGTVGTGANTPFEVAAESGVDATWNAFIQATAQNEDTKKYPILIGALYGGGNGDYFPIVDDFKNTVQIIPNELGNTSVIEIDASEASRLQEPPTLAKTYLHIGGGVFGHIYGGGNAETVTGNTVIYTNNGTHVTDTTLNRLPLEYVRKAGLLKGNNFIGLFEGYDYRIVRDSIVFDFHASRLFGGNNKAPMSIRPTWHLKKMDINSLYSGGNRGMMTYADGLILPLRSDSLRVNNVYGGCRIADVNPGATAPEAEEITSYDYDKGKYSTYPFEAGYATRVFITGGRINNVYGGNDISGKVYHGTNVEIHGAISGNVYGGGNGSYAYTDNTAWRDAHPEDYDYHYEKGTKSSVDALYDFRPHVESTLVHISGDEVTVDDEPGGNEPEEGEIAGNIFTQDEVDAGSSLAQQRRMKASDPNTVIVAGDVYCGGNSATLAKDGDPTGAKSVFKIGRHAIINGVFLGSNGINMVDTTVLRKYKTVEDGVAFSSIDLADTAQMKRYMDGVAVNIKPELQWDENLEQTTHVGSIYFGGNKGSMTYEGMNTIETPRDLIIYEKIVGGCNDACVTEWKEDDVVYNTAYDGGIIGEGTGTVGNMENVKVVLNVDAYLKPMKLDLEYDGLFVKDWDFVWDMTDSTRYETFDNHVEINRTFVDANIYGGCFNSGRIKGSTVINIGKALIHPDVYAEHPEVLRATAEDVYGSAMAVYGAGYGYQSVVEGNTQINFTDSASVLLAFGGGEMGVVTGNTEVNFDINLVLPAEHDSLNVYKAYAGGYAGEVEGNTTLNLHGGGVMRAFAGACNANIGGYTTAIIGMYDEEQDIYPKYGVPYVENAVFGGNDFGGHIMGNTLRNINVKPYKQEVIATKQVRSQTYVQYNNGNIGKAIYGGSYGSYNYNDSKMYSHGIPLEGGPFFTKIITDPSEEVITANTFVHVASKSLDSRDIIGQNTLDDPTVISAVVGGGRGYRNLPGYVKVNRTYLLLDAIDKGYRTEHMAYRVYGGGNLSVVDSTRIDVYSCYVDQIFGGTHGVKTITTEDSVAYNVKNTEINLYGNVETTDIYGAGANSGTDKATINLISGLAHNVHGGAYTEGYTLETHINVPKTSTVQVNAIFGGGQGEAESWPCDVGLANINYASGDATVEEGLFGGNNTARVTTETNIVISAPVKNKEGKLREIYGAGYGAATISGFTHIDLLDSAHVSNVHGGGKQGKVYNHYNYYGDTGDDDVNYAINDYYDNAPHRHANWVNDTIQPKATKTAPKPTDKKNTLIHIHEGAVVEHNVFGGGEGSTAYVSGETHVRLLGGLVKGDIYGGGDAGAMPRMTNATNGYIAREENNQTIATLCDIEGGQARKVFGGGLNGDIEGNTHVTIGIEKDDTTFADGVPAIQRNVYGGSERALVSDSAIVKMYNGYIGYEYMGLSKGSEPIGNYKPVLDLDDDLAIREFEDEGNIYGAGFGEGAVVINTSVNLYGGHVRNSVYGGGEIAAVGKGVVANDGNSAEVETAGSTNVRIYGGQVEGDVFGGGRGYSYTYNYTGEDSPYQMTREYTDGYVFGKTNVEIYRGTIGTTESLAQGRGNVFGGGNIGYVYSAGKKYTGETTGDLINGHYYHVNPATKDIDESHERTEDCRVHISASSKALAAVTIDGTDYAKGDTVPTEKLNTLAYNAEEWNKLDMTGLTIRNAVFAGGNVSSGSDIVYANAKTVFGNATASVVDVFNRDLISIGGEHIGGLYGDGNLTFVDGYRELNITNYGTEYEKLDTVITAVAYNNLLPRQQEYYAPYGERHKLLDGRMLNTIQRADFCGIFGSRVLLHGALDRVPDKVDYTHYAINRVGEISFNEKNGRGNYFGIYNVANFLGALTSDVLFTDEREAGRIAADGKSYLNYKKSDGTLNTDNENDAAAKNVVAQASGVYLELVKELDANGEKVYGPITGVIQLELIDVMKGEGGGYVYAKKEYGTPHKKGNTEHYTLATANQGAITQSAFYYDNDQYTPFMQTSGNFVNPKEVVVDDPYSATAHYWHIRGEHYVYDMYISAYTGTPQAFGESINIPLPTLDEAMEAFFVSVNANKYAKTKANGTPLTEGDCMQVNNKVYYLNDPITYREWSLLSAADQSRFTDEPTNKPTNEIRHNKGYVLNYGMTNPTQWERFQPTFTCNKDGIYGRHTYEVNDVVNQSVKNDNITVDANTDATFEKAYIATEEVTYHDGERLRHIFAGSYISETMRNGMSPENKSKFEEAYICNVTYQKDEKEYILTGELISTTEYQNLVAVAQAHFSPAYVCTRAGLYGGKEYNAGEQYTALQRAGLTTADLQYFDYNYDALDLLTFTDDLNTDFDTDSTTYAEKNQPGNWIGTKDIANNGADSKVPLPLTATAQLYVPRVADLSKLGDERIFTVEYWVEPKEKTGLTDDKKEKHFVNIHIQFKSGTPEIGNLATPSTVMPGSSVGLAVPTVTPGAYEVLGSGWEIYDNIQDAEAHQNGHPFTNNNTPLYWYQNEHYVAYYTKTYLGRTYSTPVPLTVANYHRIGEVMNHDEYMYIDHEDIKDRGLRPAKIYLDSATYVNASVDATKNDLDHFYDLFVATTDGRLDQKTVKNGNYLDFILRSDIDSTKYYKAWPSIGDENNCFSGTLHGNGHTIGGLDKSLFGHLCGAVYNLGVTGSFTGGGIADHGGNTEGDGYAENCWVYTTGTPTMKAIIGEGGQIVNCYYRMDNGFENGDATGATKAEFDKGEVSYNLNGFYLKKRQDKNAANYVDEYFRDGDFRFANGTIPKNADEREVEVQEDGKMVVRYNAIYPDDYIYFGQTLTYNVATHDSLPTHVDKVTTDGKVRIELSAKANRVYRAPAYYMSKTKKMAYYNMSATFTDMYGNEEMHHGLTAIDFTGNGDTPNDSILDYKGLADITLQGLTPNLLIYADSIHDETSYNNIANRMYEPGLVFDYSTDGKEYGRVNDASGNVSSIRGHLVKKGEDGKYIATRNHYLVDKANFNAPIAYTYADGYYMWYQRKPAYYSNGNKEGWESICLPFDAEVTTTQDKGQITHFYGDEDANHEYWLRELTDVNADGTIAEFQRPAAAAWSQSLVVDNSFLYDYYYSYNDHSDANNDEYQNYYNEERTYNGYPYVAAYTPYIVAFPGERYYEFDMSGQFQPKHSGEERPRLNAQMVTFISRKNAKVDVTDDRIATTVGNHSYAGAFTNTTATGQQYVMNNDGSAFELINDATIVPFRGYMQSSASAPPRRIQIGSASREEEPTEEIAERGLTIYGKGGTIFIESTLEYEAIVTIHSLSGQIVGRVTVKPMSKEVVPVSSRGVYIVNQKKIAVL